MQLTVETLTGEQMQGSSILYYDLMWNQGDDIDVWESYSLMTEAPGETLIHITINGLDSGQTYQFSYRAENIHGWSVE